MITDADTSPTVRQCARLGPGGYGRRVPFDRPPRHPPDHPRRSATSWRSTRPTCPRSDRSMPTRLAFIVDESPIALASSAATVVGFCLVMAVDSAYDSVNFRWFTERYDRFMYLDRVAFDADAQGRGLGTLLYAEVDRLMRDPARVTSRSRSTSIRRTSRRWRSTPAAVSSRSASRTRPTASACRCRCAPRSYAVRWGLTPL